jgi:hypothetical protein
MATDRTANNGDDRTDRGLSVQRRIPPREPVQAGPDRFTPPDRAWREENCVEVRGIWIRKEYAPYGYMPRPTREPVELTAEPSPTQRSWEEMEAQKRKLEDEVLF